MTCIQTVYTLVDNRKLDVANAYALVGGCEGWLQVELNMAYLRQGIKAVREQPVYLNNNALHADLWVPFTTGAQVVELKVESLGQTQKGGYDFTLAFAKDMEKVKNANFNQNVTQVWGICVACSDKAVKYMRETFVHENVHEQVVPNSTICIFYWALRVMHGQWKCMNNSPTFFTNWANLHDQSRFLEPIHH